jgi:hypothetical protein
MVDLLTQVRNSVVAATSAILHNRTTIIVLFPIRRPDRDDPLRFPESGVDRARSPLHR